MVVIDRFHCSKFCLVAHGPQSQKTAAWQLCFVFACGPWRPCISHITTTLINFPISSVPIKITLRDIDIIGRYHATKSHKMAWWWGCSVSANVDLRQICFYFDQLNEFCICHSLGQTDMHSYSWMFQVIPWHLHALTTNTTKLGITGHIWVYFSSDGYTPPPPHPHPPPPPPTPPPPTPPPPPTRLHANIVKNAVYCETICRLRSAPKQHL